MKLKRLKDVDNKTRVRLVYYLNQGRLKKYLDEAGYVCYDEDEKIVKIKTGRPPKMEG